MKKISLFFLMLFTITSIFAQQVDEVTLIVDGTAATESEAINVALRSAIEQAFGTFVSANTTILNDQAVKDEIVAISRGNIKTYEILGKTKHNGDCLVSLKATVSIGKLISYAKKKGSRAEFAGDVYSQTIKLRELRAQNTETALEHLVSQLELMLPHIFKYELYIPDPVATPRQLCKITSGKSWKAISNDEGYLFRGKVLVKATTASADVEKMIQQTMLQLALSEQESIDYEKSGILCYKFDPYFGVGGNGRSLFLNYVFKQKLFFPYTSEKHITNILKQLTKLVNGTDNLFYKNIRIVEINDSKNVYCTTGKNISEGFYMFSGCQSGEDYKVNWYNNGTPIGSGQSVLSDQYTKQKYLGWGNSNANAQIDYLGIDLFVTKDKMSSFKGFKIVEK